MGKLRQRAQTPLTLHNTHPLMLEISSEIYLVIDLDVAFEHTYGELLAPEASVLACTRKRRRKQVKVVSLRCPAVAAAECRISVRTPSLVATDTLWSVLLYSLESGTAPLTS